MRARISRIYGVLLVDFVDFKVVHRSPGGLERPGVWCVWNVPMFVPVTGLKSKRAIGSR